MTLPELKELTFDEEHHIYRLDGLSIPSVSAILKPVTQKEYGDIDEQTLAKAAAKGTSVHESLENFAKYGIMDYDENLIGYIKGFQEWWCENSPEVVGAEFRFYHKLMRYGGTADLLAYINGKLTLVDYKTTVKIVEKSVALQLEAYAQALKSQGIQIEDKIILHLRKDGVYETVHYLPQDRQRWVVFGALKTVYDYNL